MKVGDIVIWNNSESSYAKWFYGRIAEVQSVGYSSSGNLHCRVRWLEPVKYFNTFAKISDFNSKNFGVTNEA
tara:strand:+ start:355 stop:570 length:216 start_codon:yes stop_codon:yes gene_type:complete